MSLLDKLMGKDKEKNPNNLNAYGTNNFQNVQAQSSYLAREAALIDYAISLFDRGYSEAQVVDALKREGLSFDEIDRIIGEALRKRVVSQQTMQSTQNSGLESILGSNYNDFYESGAEIDSDDELDLTPIGQNEGGVLASQEGGEMVTLEDVEELVETTVEEKMQNLIEKIDAVNAKFEEIERKLNVISASVEDNKEEMNNEIKTLKNEMVELKEKVNNMEPRINGFEKAFKDIIPNLVDSVRELKEMVHELSEKVKKKK